MFKPVWNSTIGRPPLKCPQIVRLSKWFLLPALFQSLVWGAAPGNAPTLPLTGTRIVKVSTEPQLQNAMANLQSGDTILLADGAYNLTSTLYVNGRNDVTIRGGEGSTNVVLVGKGMDNSNYGGVPFG